MAYFFPVQLELVPCLPMCDEGHSALPGLMLCCGRIVGPPTVRMLT